MIKEKYTNVKTTSNVSLLEQDILDHCPSTIGVKIIAKGKMQPVTQTIVDVSKKVSNFQIVIDFILNFKIFDIKIPYYT